MSNGVTLVFSRMGIALGIKSVTGKGREKEAGALPGDEGGSSAELDSPMGTPIETISITGARFGLGTAPGGAPVLRSSICHLRGQLCMRAFAFQGLFGAKQLCSREMWGWKQGFLGWRSRFLKDTAARHGLGVLRRCELPTRLLEMLGFTPLLPTP